MLTKNKTRCLTNHCKITYSPCFQGLFEKVFEPAGQDAENMFMIWCIWRWDG